MLQVLLADDHSLIRDGLKGILEANFSPVQIKEAGSAQAAKAALTAQTFDLVILDIRMPGMAGIATIKSIQQAARSTPVLVLSAQDDINHIIAAREAGVAGFVSKNVDTDMLLHALHSVLRGVACFPREAMLPNNGGLARFSDRQQELLALLAEGHSNKEIAEQMCLSLGTVKQYVSRMLTELGVDNRAQAAIVARELLQLHRS